MSKSYTLYWSRLVRTRIEALSYAKIGQPIQLPVSQPEAYVQWGGPSSFEVLSPVEDHNPGPDARKRYIYSEKIRRFELSFPKLEVAGLITTAEGTEQIGYPSFVLDGPNKEQHRFYGGIKLPPGSKVFFSGYTPIDKNEPIPTYDDLLNQHNAED